jgi:hypothetical protein
MMLRLATLGILAILSALPHPARAADTTSPDAMQGVWSSPDCADSKKAWIISAHYFIHADAQSLSVDRITGWRKDDNNGDTLYAFTSASTEDGLLNRTNDGLMKMIRGPVDGDRPLTDAWGWTQDEVGEEYSRCVKLFDTTPQMGQSEVNSIFLLDQALDTCQAISPEKFLGSAGAACRKHLFNLVDGNGDKKLDHEELTTLERQLAFLNRGLAPSQNTPPCANPADTRKLADLLLPPGTEHIDFKALMESSDTHPDLWSHTGNLAQLLPFLPAQKCPETKSADATPIKTKDGVLPPSSARTPQAQIRP